MKCQNEEELAKRGWGLRYHWTILNSRIGLSSPSLVINDFRFDISSPQPHNKTHFLLFKQRWKGRGKKNRVFAFKKRGKGFMCRSYQAERRVVVEETCSRAPLWKALINPYLIGVLTRGGEARQETGLQTGRRGGWVGGSSPLKMLRLIKSPH